MAFHLYPAAPPPAHICCSSSVLLSSSWRRRRNHLSSHPFPFLPPLHPHKPPKVSVQDPQTSPEPSAPAKDARPRPFKNSIWVNPKSRRAFSLRRASRYSRLAELAASLDSSDALDPALHAALGDAPSEQDVVIVLNCMKNACNAVLALRWFQSRIEAQKEVILYNVVLKAMRNCKDWNGLEALWREMLERGIKPDNVTFTTVISCARICDMPEKAVKWFEMMPEFGCHPDLITYSVMIDAYGRSGNVEMALRLYDRARKENKLLDTVAFKAVIRAHNTSDNFDGALNVYEEMKALGVKPNLATYNTLLNAMGRAGRPWQVKTIYQDMMRRGLEPNKATYVTLLRAYARARCGEDALGLYMQVKEKGVVMTVTLYNTLLSMCADLGLLDKAEEIFKELREMPNGCQPDSWSYSAMITAYSGMGKVSEAESTFNDMLDSGVQPNILVVTSLVQCYGKARRTDSVVRVFDKILELGIKPDDKFCGCLLNVATQTAAEELEKIIDCIERANLQLGSLVKLLVDDGTDNETIRREAEEVFNSLSSEVKKAYCNCLMGLCVSLNHLQRACVLLDLAIQLEIYTDLQLRSSTQWSLDVRSLSLGAALTALHVWITDLTKSLQNGEDLPPLLGINTGHGKHKHTDKGLADAFQSHLMEISAPFYEAPDKVGWFLTTKVAAKSWLETRSSSDLVAA